MSTQITTGKVRFSYCSLFEPRAAVAGGQETYSVTLLIDKGDKFTLDKIKAAIEEAKQNYLQNNSGKKLPTGLKTTLHDGDGERPNGGDFGPECAGCYVITVSSKNKPVLVDKNKAPITDPQDLYSGCYGRAIINFFVYDTNGNKGISAGLNGVMKLHDGEPLSGGVVTDADWDDDWEDQNAGEGNEYEDLLG
ncbi:MAG: DUF2815 family protein [Lachnospiraceae bacterium]|nr:DUF2815 family protein [Lachnospiraceae bacterium]